MGYAAGASYRQVERVAGQASLVLLGLVATAVLLRWTAHRAIAHQEQVRAISSRLADATVARWVAGRFPTQLQWLADRLDPRVSRGLALTTVVVALIAAGWTVGAITQDVYGRDGGRVLAGGVGAWAIVVALQQLLPTPASGAPFPATEPAVVAALSVTLADVVGRSHGWAAGARATAVAAILVTDPSTWKPRQRRAIPT